MFWILAAVQATFLELSSFLAERVGPSGHVIAVDPDRERIRVAKANVKVANITFLVADGETFPEQEYNAVFCNVVGWGP